MVKEIAKGPTSEDARKFAETIAHIPVDDLKCPPEVGFVYDTTSCLDALRELLRWGASSVPVIEDRPNDENKVIDFVSLTDLAYFVSDMVVENQNLPVHYASPTMDLKFKDTSVGEVLERAGRVPIDFDTMNDFVTSTLDVVHAVVSHGCERVLISDKSGSMKTVVTTGKVMNVVMDKISLLPRQASMTLSDLGLIKKFRPAQVNTSTNGANAIKMLSYAGTSAVAVVSDEGRFVGSVTPKDISVIFKSEEMEYQFKEIYPNLVDFMEKARGSGPKIPLTLTVDSTFREAVEAFSVTGAHDIFVLDHLRRPLSLLNQGDLLGTIIINTAIVS